MFALKQPKAPQKKTVLPVAESLPKSPKVTEAEMPASKPQEAKPKTQNLIAEGTVIHGNIEAEGDVTLAGKVHGDVSTRAKLTVDVAAVIEGNIVAENADIAGTVQGTVTVRGLLTIRTSSQIDGDVVTKNLNVESGSMFTGRFDVGSTAKPASNGKSNYSDYKEAPALQSVLD